MTDVSNIACNNEPEVVPSEVSVVSKEEQGLIESISRLQERKYILKKMQSFMKKKPFHCIRRSEVAEFAQVAPSVISFHFPSKSELIKEAAGPVVQNHSDRVTVIINNEARPSEKLKALISEFLVLGLQSGYLIDYFLYTIYQDKFSKEAGLLAEQYMSINCFIEEITSRGRSMALSASFVQSSIWGQCMYLSRQPHLQALISKEERSSAISELECAVWHLLINGLGTDASEPF